MLASLFVTLAASTLATAHVILTYPGWRGNNLITNDTFPYGMQWMYPCKSHAHTLAPPPFSPSASTSS